jgi:hypothetical protein
MPRRGWAQADPKSNFGSRGPVKILVAKGLGSAAALTGHGLESSESQLAQIPFAATVDLLLES